MQTSLPLIAVNGVVGAQLSPLDRGLAYGDGLFETCKLQKGTISLWKYHSERLLAGCQKLSIPLSLAVLETQLYSLISVSGLSDAVVKITVTRGQGGRGYKPPEVAQPSIIIGVYPAAVYPAANAEDGVRVHLCTLRLGHNPALAGLKHLNRLEQVLARAEWSEDTIAEGLLLDGNDNLIEAVFSNIFMVKNNELLTPDLTTAGVSGVMRRYILDDLAPALAIKTKVRQLGLADLYAADEILLCNSLYGIWPVCEILADQPLQKKPGPMTRQLQKGLAASLHA
jgi:4-amino-4-deoxychorismate lyase